MNQLNAALIAMLLTVCQFSWGQGMTCKSFRSSSAQSCGIAAEKLTKVLKDVSTACKSTAEVGNANDFYREYKLLRGQRKISVESLKTEIESLKISLTALIEDKIKKQNALKSFDEDDYLKRSAILDDLNQKMEKISSNYAKNTSESKLNTEKKAAYRRYLDEKDEVDVKLIALGPVSDKETLSSEIRESELNANYAKSEIEKNEKTLVRLKLASNKKEQTEADDLEEVKLQVKEAAAKIRMRSGYVDCGLTDLELYAIQLYTGEYFQMINSSLRSDDVKEREKFKATVAIIETGLSKLEPYVRLTRRVTTLDDEAKKAYCEGCVVTMKALTSTSIETAFLGSQKVVIKGKTGAFIAPVSSTPGDKEVLFPTNTKFKVIKVEGDDYTMEEVD